MLPFLKEGVDKDDLTHSLLDDSPGAYADRLDARSSSATGSPRTSAQYIGSMSPYPPLTG